MRETSCAFLAVAFLRPRDDKSRQINLLTQTLFPQLVYLFLVNSLTERRLLYAHYYERTSKFPQEQ